MGSRSSPGHAVAGIRKPVTGATGCQGRCSSQGRRSASRMCSCCAGTPPVPRPGCLEPVCSVVRSIVCRCQRALAPASKGAAEILPQAVDAAGSASSFGEGGKRSFFPLGLSSTAILDAGGVGCQLRARAVWASGIGMELNGRKEGEGTRLEGKQTVGGRAAQRTRAGGPAFAEWEHRAGTRASPPCLSAALFCQLGY